MLDVGNAAGWVKTPEQAARLLPVPSDVLASITLGSYTLTGGPGNSGNTFWSNDDVSLNALGLPNPGIDAVQKFLPEIQDKVAESRKELRVSVAGNSVDDYVELVGRLQDSGVDEIELNLGCPNVRTGGTQKPIFAFYPGLIEEIVYRTYELVKHRGAPRLALKLSPYSNPEVLSKVARTLMDLPSMVHLTIVTCNTFPNGLAMNPDDMDKRVITPNNGYAGLGGKALKYIALGQVARFREILDDRFTIIGVGGISSGRDIFEMEQVGADAVQVGTAFFTRDDPRFFVQLAEDYVNFCDS